VADLLTLQRKLQGCYSADELCRYIVQMWNYTLEICEERVQSTHECCDAIPYVPFEPESLGLNLGKDSTVLDVGCLGGYGLYDFALRRVESGREVPKLIGVDTSLFSVKMGLDLAQCWNDCANVSFIQMDGACLAFSSDSMDMIIARLLLPYVIVSNTLTDVSRVLRRNGLILFQIHSFKYYRESCMRSIPHAKRCLYYMRALLSGVAFGITRRQPRHRWFREMAMGRSTLILLCRSHGLVPVWEGGSRSKPMVAFQKRA
jgi:SAM-dependent methyltransferase